MNVLLITHGTRGDIQPFVALAITLKHSGHDVFLAAPTSAIEIAKKYNIDVNVELNDTFRTLVTRVVKNDGMEGPDAIKKPTFFKRIARTRSTFGHALNNITEVAKYPADVVIYNSYIFSGPEIANYLGVPAILGTPDETAVPTSSFPHPLRAYSLPPVLRILPPRLRNRASWHLGIVSGTIVRILLSRDIGYPKRSRGRTLPTHLARHSAAVIQASSPHILPHPLKYPSKVHLTGYWFLPAPENWSPSPELRDFINEGDPPICFGFGSLVVRDPVRVSQIIRDTVNLLGRRAIVLGGWGGISPNGLGDKILYLDDAPFDWLFPRMAVLVHHAGTGTVAAGLAAGRPQVLCPLGGHGRFQANLLYAQGVAPPPLLKHEFNSDNLYQAISRVLEDRQMNERARDLQEKIRSEGGVRAAVKLVESLV